MLMVAISSMIIVILILFVHYKNHYSSCICQYTNDSHTNCIQKYVCKLIPINQEKYHTFVPAFIRYTVFIILSCFVVIVIDIIDYINNTNSITPIFNYILIYQVLTISIWESSFTFVRYYATRGTTQFFINISKEQIYKKFMIYAVLFSILYLLQIHIYYWLLPIVVICKIVFNIYYNHHFAAILLKQYNAFQFEDDFIEIVNKVKLLQSISIIYGISQALSLTVFIMTYNINDIYLHSQPFIVNRLSYMVHTMPLFWCISTGVYAISFVRNQTHFQRIKSKFPKLKFQMTKAKLEETIIEVKDEKKQNQPTQPTQPTVTDNELLNAMPCVNETPSIGSMQLNGKAQSAPPIPIPTPITKIKMTETPRPNLKNMHNSKSEPVVPATTMTMPPEMTLNVNTPPISEGKEMVFTPALLEPLDLDEIENSMNNISFEATLDTLSKMKSYGFLPEMDTIKATKSIRKMQTLSFSKRHAMQLSEDS